MDSEENHGKYLSLQFHPKAKLSYLEFDENHGELNLFKFAFKCKAIVFGFLPLALPQKVKLFALNFDENHGKINPIVFASKSKAIFFGLCLEVLMKITWNKNYSILAPKVRP